MYPRQHWSATLTPIAYCGPARLSAAHWWSLSPSRSSGARNCSSWNLGWRSMVNITGVFCWWRRCCQRPGDVQRLLHLPAGPRPSTSSKGHHCVAAMWNTKLHWTGTLVSKLTRPQSSWIWGLIQERVYQTATAIRVEGAPRRCVGRVEAKCHWQSYWTVVAKAESLRPSEGTSLRTSY